MRLGHGIVIVLLTLASLRAMGADAVRIAILAGEGERTPKVGMVDRLMAELSKRPEVMILEREAIGKILAEQKLSLSGLTDHAHAVRLGLLLGADALLAVERALLDVEDHNDPQYLRPVFRKPVRRLRFTVVEIHESEVVDFEDPPWLNLSEITFFERREWMR